MIDFETCGRQASVMVLLSFVSCLHTLIVIFQKHKCGVMHSKALVDGILKTPLTTIGKDDPVGELNRSLWNSGNDSDKEIARKENVNFLTMQTSML